VNQHRNPAFPSAATRIPSRSVGRWLAAGAGALSLAAAACSATGNIQGGQYILPVIDAGVVETSAAIPDLTLPASCSDGGENSGIRWQDLYACYFGPSGVASCAGTVGNCHGEPDGLGATITGFNCAPGDSTACLTSMEGYGLFAAGQDPQMTTLFSVLRQSPGEFCSAGSCMPLMPADVVFGPDDMARIGSWIDSGVPNN
jgi:hypothetical protein